MLSLPSGSHRHVYSSRALTKPSHPELGDLPSNVEFRDSPSAARSLRRLACRLTPDSLTAACRLLAESPDPDSVLVFLDRLLEASPHEIPAMFAAQPSLLHYASLVFGHSQWLGEALLRNTDLFRRFGRERDLQRSRLREEFREEFARWYASSGSSDLSSSLAHFRKREYIRILLRDLLAIAKLAETTEEISALADSLVEIALSEVSARWREQHGAARSLGPDGRLDDCRFAVVSLGKLGGNELNYNSDIDLLFLYDGGVAPPGTTVSNRPYFTSMAQEIIEMLSRPTREGQVFRIDLRLRPQGHEGELAVALPRAVQYYSEIAEDWELQAMIKARHSAGDVGIAQQFVSAIAPYVYRPNVNFSAVKTALQSRERFDKRGRNLSPARAAHRGIDVKLDRGGIRDIEFLVQCLQRVYGGEERWLRSRGTLFALQKLHDKEHIGGKDFHQLTKAYEFLRELEHHLQLRYGQQSHQLPKNPAELKVLARCMSRNESVPLSLEAFMLNLEGRMAAVAEIYRRIVYQEQSQQFIDAAGNLKLQPPAFPSAENSYSRIMQRLAVDSPRLLATITKSELSPHGRRHLNRFLSSAATSSERYGAVLRSPAAVVHALRIFETSDYLTDILVRHPADVALLGGFGEQPRPELPPLFSFLDTPQTPIPDPLLAYLANSNMERLEATSLFRQQFRQAMFMANARDLFHPRGVFEILRENSVAAERAIDYAVAMADAPSGFAVMALGRLGSGEFDVLSDADVLFLSADATGRADARRAAERIVELLTAYTRAGSVFPVDTRLRPRGREGELVTSPGHLANYFASGVQPWEAISYLRLRFVAGDRTVAEEAQKVVQDGIGCVARRSRFDFELDQMRQRLEESDTSPNFKTGPGGTYDIDFLCGKLQARHGLGNDGNLVERIDSLRQRGLIAAADASTMEKNAEFLRWLEHYVRLVTGRAARWLPTAEHARLSLAKLYRGVTSQEEVQFLGEALTAVVESTRDIYRKYPF